MCCDSKKVDNFDMIAMLKFPMKCDTSFMGNGQGNMKRDIAMLDLILTNIWNKTNQTPLKVVLNKWMQMRTSMHGVA